MVFSLVVVGFAPANAAIVSRLDSAPGQSQSDWEATDAYKAFTCPEGTLRGAGVDLNFTTDRSDDKYFVTCDEPTPVAAPPSRIPYTQPCVGGSDRTPGLPQCLMPEGLGGSAWNLVDNNSGVVVNGAVCSEAVCGRNGEWRQWPADRKLNDRLWPTGFPEGATYIQTPFDSAYWGRYFTNGVYEVNGGGILQPGSKTIVWPVQTPAP